MDRGEPNLYYMEINDTFIFIVGVDIKITKGGTH